MANFPSNPSNGNTHVIGNTTWVYNSTSDSWLIQDVNEYAVANLQNTPPANPDEGTLWYDSQTTGRLFIYIDGSWIDASPSDTSNSGSWGSTAAPTSVTSSYTATGSITFVARSWTTATFVGANAPTPSVTNNSGNAWTSIVSQGGVMQSSINTPTVVIGYAEATDVITATQIDYWDA